MSTIDQKIDTALRAQMAQLTGGIATEDYTRAYLDWLRNFAASSQAQTDLFTRTLQTGFDTWQFATLAWQNALQPDSSPAPTSNDSRFDNPAWQQWPFNVYAQSFSNWSRWLHESATNVAGDERAQQAADGLQRPPHD